MDLLRGHWKLFHKEEGPCVLPQKISFSDAVLRTKQMGLEFLTLSAASDGMECPSLPTMTTQKPAPALSQPPTTTEVDTTLNFPVPVETAAPTEDSLELMLQQVAPTLDYSATYTPDFASFLSNDCLSAPNAMNQPLTSDIDLLLSTNWMDDATFCGAEAAPVPPQHSIVDPFFLSVATRCL